MLEKRYLVDQVAGSTIKDTISLSDIWLTLRRQFRKILKITAVLLFLAVLFISFSAPTFVSTASLYTSGIAPTAPVNDNDLTDTNASTYLNYLSTFGGVTDVQTQTDIITSPALVQDAVLASGLNATLDGPGLGTPSYLFWKLFYGGSVGAFAPDQLKLSVSDAFFSDPSVKQRKYRVIFQTGGHYLVRFEGDPVLQGVLNQPASGGGLNLLLKFSDPNLAPAPGSSYKLVVSSPVITTFYLLNSGLAVVPGGTATSPSELINVSFKGENPYQAQAFVSMLISEYVDKTVSWNSAAANKMEDFITGQLNDVKAKLAAADQKLADYQQQTGVISPPDNAKDAVDQEANYESQRVELEIEIKALQQVLSSLDNPVSQINPYLISQTQGTPISLLSEAMATDLATLKNLESRYTADNPQVVSLQAQIQQERVGIRSMLKNELADAQANLSGVNEEIGKYQKQIGAMPAQSLEVTELTNSSGVLGQLYILLMQKQQEAAISKTAAGSSTQIVMPAQLPWKSQSPRPIIILPLVMILGLLGGSSWVLLKNGLDGRLNTTREIHELAKTDLVVSAPIGASKNPYFTRMEFEQAFQTLRVNLLQGFTDGQSKVILITAGSGEEQKSLVAYNLAKAVSAAGKKVALVDADFQTGRLRTLLDFNSRKGLSNWLFHGEPVALQNLRNESFALLPAGTDGEMGSRPLDESRLSSILTDLRNEYDFVIVDGPTPPRIADLLTFATRADAILSVIQTEVSTRQAVVAQQRLVLPINALHGVVTLVS